MGLGHGPSPRVADELRSFGDFAVSPTFPSPNTKTDRHDENHGPERLDGHDATLRDIVVHLGEPPSLRNLIQRIIPIRVPQLLTTLRPQTR